MTEERKNILLWRVYQVGKYSPIFNEKFRDISREDRIVLGQKYRSRTLEVEKCNFILRWKLRTEFEEKRLRTYDCFYDGTGMFLPDAFFVHDWLLECWQDLIGKDLRIIPTECYTENGLVKEFHLVYVMNQVDGVDESLSGRPPGGGKYKIVPKATNEFMEGHEIALEKEWQDILITPSLKERTLKVKKKIKDVCISTYREWWDDLWSSSAGPY